MKPGDMIFVTDDCPSKVLRGAYGHVTEDAPGVEGCVIVDLGTPINGKHQINARWLRAAIQTP